MEYIDAEVSEVLRDDIDFIFSMTQQNNLGNWSKTDYLNEVDRKDSAFLILKNKNTKIGFILARLITNNTYTVDNSKSENENENESEIYNFCIDENYRMKGYGEKLLNHLLDLCKNSNIRKVWLEVRESNAGAINFYQKSGFTIQSTRKGYYSNPVENALQMRLILT